jgi:hypothetical protein
MSASLFASNAPRVARKSRYTLAPATIASTDAEGGIVALGEDGNGVPFIVSDTKTGLLAVPVQAVVTALQAEAIPVADVVKVFADVGKLDILAAAVAAAKPKAPASK